MYPSLIRLVNVKDPYFHIGAYDPLTRDGNIVVDAVLASCYASFHHDLAHTAMKPFFWFPKLIEWFFDINNGSPGYIDLTKELGRLVLPAGQTY